ncbi:SpoIID/LytB domain protein [Isoptericola jiangsuensis]|uniref:SpoIID/LytB domain protein n=1 Tax=Isoptericola jiangsuensis TaxID=548579 RepID=A0A2A9EYY5_9MICO|nr:SpoIID/LytB domain-containing protein [Isoptericola jiangsuensis]PFG44078.1 SpoIID/LytB domain protein [Isoptericola jiangsuensis]
MEHRRLHRALAGAVALLVAAAGGLAVAAPASAAVPDDFTVTGSGYGHGVGMSQFGAYELAREGRSAVKILRHYYSGSKVPYTSTPKRVRVQVYGPDPYGYSGYGDSGRTTITVSGGDWRVRVPGKGTVAQGSGTKTLKVRIGAKGNVRVRVDDRTHVAPKVRIQWSGTTYWRPSGRTAVATVVGTHGSYKNGRLTIQGRSGTPNITNDVLLNTEYLYGIAEMPSSWGLNGGDRALRAQAVTARSYALSKIASVRTACDCHVVDDVRDQNYAGWRKEAEGTGGRYGAAWKKAVDATTRDTTTARVLQVGGRPVAAHYFSSSGGRTANSEDVWSSALSYERSVADPYSLRAPGNSYRSWTRTITQAKARQLFGLQNVASIKVTRTWSSGQMRTLTATQPDGTTATLTGKADQMRAWVGRATTRGSLPAAWVSRISG